MAYYFPDPEQSLSDIAHRVELISDISMFAMAIASIIMFVGFRKAALFSFNERRDEFVRNDDLSGYWRFKSILAIRLNAIFMPILTLNLIHYTARVIIPDNPGMLWGAIILVAFSGIILMLNAYAIYLCAAGLANGFEASQNTRRVRKMTAYFHKRRAELLTGAPLNAKGADN